MKKLIEIAVFGILGMALGAAISYFFGLKTLLILEAAGFILWIGISLVRKIDQNDG